MFEVDGRLKKAKKVIKILQKHLGELSNKNLLDIGCSSGIMTDYYADFLISSGIITITITTLLAPLRG